jgi:hypothetical protein
MAHPGETPFIDLDDADLAACIEAAYIAQDYRAGVLDNLRTLQIHARRVSEALAADPDAPATPGQP